jgi:hypothetical protein
MTDEIATKDKLLVATTSNLEFLFSDEGSGSDTTICIYRPKLSKKYLLLGDYLQVRPKLSSNKFRLESPQMNALVPF